ncbi:MAG: helix-hairpin-helix domain-containing protein [Bacteroidota bacterium]
MRLNKWKYLFKSYFTYTVKEQRAIVVLLIFIVFQQLFLLAMHFVPLNGISPNDYVVEDTLSKVEEYKHHPKNTFVHSKNDKTNFDLFQFDPNTIQLSDWMALGLTEKQAQAILKYIAKGGRFKTKQDLKKMRMIHEQLLIKWWKHIQLPDNEIKALTVFHKKDSFINLSPPKLNINVATTDELDALPLIGEGRAKAIVAYRMRLGGYISLDQLTEVKCLPDSVLKAIQARIYTDGKVLKSLNINSDSLFHPYLPKNMAKMIVSYRQQHGNYQRIEDLSVLPLYDDKIMRKIAPYLTVTP